MIHSFKLSGFNIIVDAGSGSIHCVDDVAYDAIRVYEREGRKSAAAWISREYAGLDEGEIVELFGDIEELKGKAALFAEETYIPEKKEAPETPVKALCMNVSHMCNMTCSYCFARGGGYDAHGALMSLDTGKRAIDFLVENSGGRKRLDVDFFGGEPLLNWETVKGIVRHAREREAGCGKVFRFTLTTNGSLVDEDVIDFTTREMHNVVLSLDGRRETNDAARTFLDGGGSYDAVLPKIRRLVEARGGKGYYIRGTYTRSNLDFASDILHMADLGFKELSMEPVVAKQGAPHALAKGDLPEIFGQYELLAEEMIRRKKEARGFTFYHYKLDLTGGPCIYKRLAGCGVGTEYMAVTPDGHLYPCHQFIGEERFLLGDIWRGATNEKLRKEFAGCGIRSRPECRGCWARLYCSGGCAANAYSDTGSIAGVYGLGCELFKKRLECAIMMKVVEGTGDRGQGTEEERREDANRRSLRPES